MFKLIGMVNTASYPLFLDHWYSSSSDFHHTHEQNGIVDCHHRHIVETRLTLLIQCKAPLRFCNYAFETSIYLINHMPTLVLDNRSPFDCLFQRSPDYHFLCTFRCLCFSFLCPYHNHKLDFCFLSICVF
jgi:hypothetical protein